MSFARPGLSLFVLSTLLCAPGCSSLTEPSVDSQVSVEPAPAAPEPPKAPRRERPERDAGAEAPAEMIGASHILIKFKGAERADKITRSKDEARKLAEDVLKRVKKGEDFAEVAKQLSEDEGTKARGGHLPHFPRGGVFGDAAADLKPGQISDVVETRFGFHVIKRDP